MSTFLAEYTDGGPGCMRDDCMVFEKINMSTAVHYPTLVDSTGQVVDKNQHVTTKHRQCRSCGKTWIERWQHGRLISSI